MRTLRFVASAAALLLLAGCASSTASRPRILVATLGDGVTAGSPGYDPNPRERAVLGFGSDVESQWQYWAAREHPDLRFRNCGVYGQRTDQIARRLDACARGARILVVQGGFADLAEGRSPGATAANLRRMVVRGRALGLCVEVAELIPWNNGYPAAARRIRRLNTLIRAIGRSEHVPVLPFYETLEDPRAPDRMPEGWTADGDNPSVAGYRRLGELAFRLP